MKTGLFAVKLWPRMNQPYDLFHWVFSSTPIDAAAHPICSARSCSAPTLSPPPFPTWAYTVHHPTPPPLPSTAAAQLAIQPLPCRRSVGARELCVTPPLILVDSIRPTIWSGSWHFFTAVAGIHDDWAGVAARERCPVTTLTPAATTTTAASRRNVTFACFPAYLVVSLERWLDGWSHVSVVR
jgi:hypothetical protein